MKQTLSALFGILLVLYIFLNPLLLDAQCPDNNIPYNTSSITCNQGVPQFQNLETCIWGGEYQTVNVTKGRIYTFRTCGDDDFDTQITLYDFSSNLLGYNDDYCIEQSQVTWIATFTGQIKVLIDRKDCVEDITDICMTLQGACEIPCEDNNTSWPENFPTTVLSCGTGYQVIGTEFHAGHYRPVFVEIGHTYRFRTCGYTAFNTQLSLYDNDSNLLAYNDDYCGPYQSFVSWTATFTGTIKVLLDQYSCQSNNIDMTIEASCTAPYACPNTLPLVCDSLYQDQTVQNQVNDFNENSYLGCNANNYSYDGPDVVYEMEVYSKRNVRFVLDIHPNQAIDLDMFLLLECSVPPTLTAQNSNFVNCIERSTANNTATNVYTEVLDVILEPGTYYLVVDGKNANDIGSFDLGVYCTCGCVEPPYAEPSGIPIVCEDFEDYELDSLSIQSTRWRKWSNNYSDVMVQMDGENQCIQIQGNEEFGDPALLYLLDDLPQQRSRISWRMKIDSAKGGYYNFQHVVPGGNSVNWAFRVFFDGDGTGRLYKGEAIAANLVASFTYPENQWFVIMHMIDPNPFANVAEFWIDYDFIATWDFDFGDPENNNDLKAITFFSVTNNSYKIDDLCIRQSVVFDCVIVNDDELCIKNGQKWNVDLNDCVGMYSILESEPCFDVCDQGGTFIFRSDSFPGELGPGNLAPAELKYDPCVIEAFGGTIPTTLYGDIYVFYNDTSISVGPVINSDNAKVFIYQCGCDENGDCGQMSLGELDGSGNCQYQDTTSAEGFYYIAVLSTVPDTYTLQVFPNGPCQDIFSTNLNCNETIQSSLNLNLSKFEQNGVEGDYISCYNGDRLYEGNEQVYRFDVDNPSFVSFELNNGSTEEMGLFIYSFLCGRNCMAYSETAPNDSIARIDSLQLSQGVYYVVVDKNSTNQSTDNDYSLTVTCASDEEYFPTFINANSGDVCLQDTSQQAIHEVRIHEDAVVGFPPEHYIVYTLDTMYDSRIVTFAPWGNVPLQLFEVPRDNDQVAPKCAYEDGDLLRVNVYYDTEGFNDNGGICNVLFSADDDDDNVTADSLFMSGGKSVIEYLEITDLHSMNVSPPCVSVAAAAITEEIHVNSDLPWTVEEEEDVSWINNINPPSAGAYSPLRVEFDISENEEQTPRDAVLLVTYGDDPPVTHRVIVKQRGICIDPEFDLAIAAGSNEICAGETITIEPEFTVGDPSQYMYSWSTGAITPTITETPLSDTTYSVTISDMNCTRNGFASISIAVGSPPNIDLGSDTILCAGSSVILDANVSGTGPFEYSWEPGGSTGPSIDVSPDVMTAYTLTVTDANDCSAMDTVVVNIQPLPEAIALAVGSITCAVDTVLLDGTASIVGSGSPVFEWSGPTVISGTNAATAVAGAAGTYTLVVNDEFGCMDETTVEVLEIEAPTVSIIDFVNIQCHGEATGSAIALGSDGTMGYEFIWNDGTTGPLLMNVAAGIYTVTLTDAEGCTDEESVMITEEDDIVLTIDHTDISCNGINDGTAQVTASGGVGGFSYEWCNGGTEDSVEGLAPGNCSVTVTDLNGCSKTADVFVEVPPPINIAVDVTNVSCNGGMDGFAAINASGGTGTLSYHWCNGQTSTVATGLSVGYCSVTVTDGNNCQDSLLLEITEPAALSAELIINHVSCFGGTDGSITAIPQNGTAPYTFLWCNGQDSSTVTGLGQGDCVLILKDSNNCSFETVVAINQNAPMELGLMADSVSCFEGNDGQAEAQVTGGSGTYTYLWSDGQNTSTATGLTAGFYQVTASDEDNCTITGIIEVAQPDLLQANITQSDISCYGGNDGSALAEPTGGTPPYTFLWCDGSSTNNVSERNAGNCLLQITDANNCSFLTILDFENPPELMLADTVSDVSCFGGSDGEITVNPSGGSPNYTFLWDNGETTQTISGLTAGIYTVTVTDNENCTKENTIEVEQPLSALEVEANAVGATCGDPNGSIDLTVSGGTPGYTFSWTPNISDEEDLSGLLAGTYSVIVSDANQCSVSLNIVVSTPSNLNASTTIDSVSCNGGSDGAIDLIVEGGTPPYTYLWSQGLGSNEDLMDLPAGMYTVTVTDADDCEIITGATVSEPDVIMVSANISPTTCGLGNGAIELTVNGGNGNFVYDWSNGLGQNPDQDDLPTGNYTLTVTDSKGCTEITSFDVDSIPEMVLTLEVEPISCPGGVDGSIDLEIDGGQSPYEYQWEGPVISTEEDLESLSAGVYTVTVTDIDSCQQTASVELIAPVEFNIESIIEPATCDEPNGSISLEVTGGTSPYSYSWDNGSPDTSEIYGLGADLYLVTITDFNECTTVFVNDLESIALMTPDQVTITNVSCNGLANGSIQIDITGGNPPFSYSWDQDSDTTSYPQDLPPGSYSVIVTDTDDCTIEAGPFEINEPEPIQISGYSIDASCGEPNGSIIIDTLSGGTGAYDFLWSSGDTIQNLTELIAGQYTLSLTDENMCMHTFEIEVMDPGAPDISFEVFDAACFGESSGAIDLEIEPGTGVPPFSYLWNTASMDTSQDISSIPEGNYTVTLTDFLACEYLFNFMVGQASLLIIDTFNVNDVQCFGESNGSASLTATGGTTQYDFFWPDGDESEMRNDLEPGSYWITVEDAEGCKDSIFISIGQPDEIIIGIDTIYEQDTSLMNANGGIDITVTGGAGGYSYEWSQNGMFYSSDEDLSGLEAGVYNLVVTDMTGCTQEYEMILVLVGTDELYLTENDLRVFPNPTNGFLQIEFLQPVIEPVEIEMLDVLGKKVLSYSNQPINGRTISLNLNAYPKGIYLIKILVNGRTFVQKIILQ